MAAHSRLHPIARRGRRRRAAAAALFLALAAAVATAAEGPAGAEPPDGSVLLATAAAERGRLEDRRGTARAPEEMITRLLSRFFVTYMLPESPDELRRVLGAAERIADRAADLFLRAASAAALSAGAERIATPHLQEVFARLLPSRTDPWDQVVFFPDTAPTPVETWDLAAFLDTGFAWEALVRLAERDAAAPEPALAFEPAAVRTLAGAVNAYGLLLFRLGGEHARAELAPHLRTSHLRAAFKTIADRAAGEAAPIAAPEPAAVGTPLFHDVTAAAGIDFRHVTSPWLSRFRRYGPIAPTFSGGGAAAADFDGDGWPDLVLCGGRGCRLFRNLGGGAFGDETERAGIAVAGEARMPLPADLDDDGLPDLFVTYAGERNRLFHNRGQGRFQEVGVEAGLGEADEISGPAAAMDVDGDGRLDLYVGNFGDYRRGELPWTSPDARNGQPNRLFRNRGDAGSLGLRFEDVTEAAGVGDPGWAQALSHLDLDRDGDQDLYVANDFGRNELFANRGDGTFEAAGEATGSDDPFHGMNVAFADLNADARAEIFISNIWAWSPARQRLNESNTLLLSEPGAGGLRYRRAEVEALEEHDTGWAWAALFLDVENDGDDDLAIANGFTDYLIFTQHREHPELPGQLYPISHRREPNVLLLNDGGVFELRPDSGLELPESNSRTLVALDHDLDGDLDLAVTTFHGPARLLENRAPGSGGWLRVALDGGQAAGVPRDPVGAVVTARPAGGPPVWRALTGGEGYLGRSEPVLGFGLGTARAADLEIEWPDGRRQVIRDLPAGRRVKLSRRGAGE